MQDAEGLFEAAAEAMALLREYQMAASLGRRSIIIESDYLESISYLLDSLENGSWEDFPTLAKVKRLGESFKIVTGLGSQD